MCWLMCGFFHVLMLMLVCWCVDVLMCCRVDVLTCWWLCWWLCWCVDVGVLVCWCVDVDVLVLMTVLMCWCIDVSMCWLGRDLGIFSRSFCIIYLVLEKFLQNTHPNCRATNDIVTPKSFNDNSDFSVFFRFTRLLTFGWKEGENALNYLNWRVLLEGENRKNNKIKYNVKLEWIPY